MGSRSCPKPSKVEHHELFSSSKYTAIHGQLRRSGARIVDSNCSVQVQRQNVKMNVVGTAPKSTTPVSTLPQSGRISHNLPKPAGPGDNQKQEARLDRMGRMMTTLITEMDVMSKEDTEGGVEQVVRSCIEPPSKKKKLRKHPSAS